MIWRRRIHVSIKVKVKVREWQAVLLPRRADREIVAKHPSVTVLFLCLMQTTALEVLIC